MPDSSRSYSGEEVVLLLDIMAGEADAAVKEAYAEGYKAALLETVPENTRLAELNRSLTAQLIAEQKRLNIPWWTIPVATVTGGFIGYAAAFLQGR